MKETEVGNAVGKLKHILDEYLKDATAAANDDDKEKGE
jgi:hypothetical protein